MSRVAAAVRSRAYRAFTRLPHEAVEARGGVAVAVARRLTETGPVTVASGPGVGLTLRLPLMHIQAYGLVRGTLEPGVQEALRRLVAPGSVVWDVGANLGFFSLLAARLGASVEAFEPLPGAAAALRSNVALNGMDGAVRVHERAAGAAAGRAPLLVVDEGSWSHLAVRGPHLRAVGTVEVEVAALDELALPAPAVVKLDVEGSELAVLQGMRATLAAARPAVICELHATNAEVTEFLEDAGYAVENLDGPAPVREAGPVHVLGRPR